MSRTKKAGVYAIFLRGKPFAYVGESEDIESRLVSHRGRWMRILELVVPDISFECCTVREMPAASQARRRRTEAALSKLLRGRGYILLSMTAAEVGHAGISKFTPEERRLRGRAITAKLTPEGLRARGRSISTALARFSPEERRARAMIAVKTRGPELNRALGNRLAAFIATMSPDQRSARTAAGWVTRRSRQGMTT